MITLIATVLNEGDNIHHLMQGLLKQTQQADEIIIVDGGSTDNTLTIIRSYADRLPLRIIVEPGCNISQGRNIGIREAKGDLLAITDAGVRLPDTWLHDVVQPLLHQPEVTVSCGFFKADPHSTFEAAMGAAVLPLAHEVDPATFLPSSRSVALRKSAAQAVTGYPEWLDYCEDLVFDLRLKATQPPFAFVPQAAVDFRPRSSMQSYFLQYYRYARGDGKANLWLKRHIIRYVTYGIAAPLLLFLAIAVHPIFWGVLLLGAIVYFYQPYTRVAHIMPSAPDRSALAWAQVYLLIPIIRVVGDIAKMIGYPVGVWWRLQHRPPDWRVLS